MLSFFRVLFIFADSWKAEEEDGAEEAGEATLCWDLIPGQQRPTHITPEVDLTNAPLLGSLAFARERNISLAILSNYTREVKVFWIKYVRH